MDLPAKRMYSLKRVVQGMWWVQPKMDRCEDVEPNVQTNKVYVNCTLNPKRGTEEYEGSNPVNPRIENDAGHTIEITPPDGDHTAMVMEWELLLMVGSAEHQAQYGSTVEYDAMFACPDNAAVDPKGRLWITTDGSQKVLGIGDGFMRSKQKDGEDAVNHVVCFPLQKELR